MRCLRWLGILGVVVSVSSVRANSSSELCRAALKNLFASSAQKTSFKEVFEGLLIPSKTLGYSSSPTHAVRLSAEHLQALEELSTKAQLSPQELRKALEEILGSELQPDFEEALAIMRYSVAKSRSIQDSLAELRAAQTFYARPRTPQIGFLTRSEPQDLDIFEALLMLQLKSSPIGAELDALAQRTFAQFPEAPQGVLVGILKLAKSFKTSPQEILDNAAALTRIEDLSRRALGIEGDRIKHLKPSFLQALELEEIRLLGGLSTEEFSVQVRELARSQNFDSWQELVDSLQGAIKASLEAAAAREAPKP